MSSLPSAYFPLLALVVAAFAIHGWLSFRFGWARLYSFFPGNHRNESAPVFSYRRVTIGQFSYHFLVELSNDETNLIIWRRWPLKYVYKPIKIPLSQLGSIGQSEWSGMTTIRGLPMRLLLSDADYLHLKKAMRNLSTSNTISGVHSIVENTEMHDQPVESNPSATHGVASRAKMFLASLLIGLAASSLAFAWLLYNGVQAGFSPIETYLLITASLSLVIAAVTLAWCRKLKAC